MVFVGKPDDGSEDHLFVGDGDTYGQLVTRGLLYKRGANWYDLTEEGEILYGELTRARS